MPREQCFKIRCGDYGHEFHFYMKGLDGKVYTIPTGATLTFEAYKENAAALKVNNTANVSIVGVNADGHIKYITQSTDWVQGDQGTYWGRVKINTITSEEIKIIAVSEYAGGE